MAILRAKADVQGALTGNSPEMRDRAAALMNGVGFVFDKLCAECGGDFLDSEESWYWVNDDGHLRMHFRVRRPSLRS